VQQCDDPNQLLAVLLYHLQLPGEERYAAAIHGKVLPHSRNLREGLAETLALIGNRANSLTHCTQGKANTVAVLITFLE
jgi:hypothetical protein